MTIIESTLVQRIEAELSAYTELGYEAQNIEGLISPWRESVITEPKRFMNNDGSLNMEALRNFRRSQIFLSDVPAFEVDRPNLRNLIGGERRGHKKTLLECLSMVEEQGFGDLLRKYPCPPTGNPYVFRSRGYTYTHLWTRHIYFAGLLDRVLANQLNQEFVALDIGSSYGLFSSLVKQEHAKSHHVLVDFPGQLILAYYFLSTYLPEARIAGANEIKTHTELSSEFFQQYDFVLLPLPYYQQISLGSIDLISNFVSLAEMSRNWFEYYTDAPVFKSAKYFFTVNRVQSFPIYDNDLTILDYPIWDADKKLHFGLSPVTSRINTYSRRGLFFNERSPRPPTFEYIGMI